MTEFAPRLDILPKPQRRLWEELAATPEQFTLLQSRCSWRIVKAWFLISSAERALVH
jgi:hypothetical protein